LRAQLQRLVSSERNTRSWVKTCRQCP